ncbi:hypothetical protein ACEPAG_3054 [Sanghuangporus baumii]
MSFSYAEVANASYRRGSTPSTPVLTRSGSSLSSTTFRNVTNTTPGAAAPEAPKVSETRGSTKGPVSAAAVKAVTKDASSMHTAKRKSGREAQTSKEISTAPDKPVEDAFSMRRPKRKAATEAHTHWESVKKKTRSSKKARVGTDGDALGATKADANDFFATPPPCSPPRADEIRTVRQPAPRDKSASKFHVWRVEESDAPSSTASDAEGPSPEEMRRMMRKSAEEEYVSKRRELKARKKAEEARRVAEQIMKGECMQYGSWQF